MKALQPTKNSVQRKKWLVILSSLLSVVLVSSFVGIMYFVVKGRALLNEHVQAVPIEYDYEIARVVQFPVGVDAHTEEISENPNVNTYFETYVSVKEDTSTHTSWLPRMLGKLALMNWYQNLASLSTRILIIESGERKEEVATHFGKILKWDVQGKNEFLTHIASSTPELIEGKFFPGAYVVPRGATPGDVAKLVTERFSTEVLARYGESVESQVPLAEALVVASLLEREAYDFEDMRHISGVIWNRLFTDMRLQIDASLQYVKGSEPNQPWWPKVLPSDKYLASAYNTYKNEGLPPAPIANPSLDAILAALNPTETDCMFYFHDKQAGFHCSVTYEEHVASLKQYYGQGK